MNILEKFSPRTIQGRMTGILLILLLFFIASFGAAVFFVFTYTEGSRVQAMAHNTSKMIASRVVLGGGEFLAALRRGEYYLMSGIRESGIETFVLLPTGEMLGGPHLIRMNSGILQGILGARDDLLLATPSRGGVSPARSAWLWSNPFSVALYGKDSWLVARTAAAVDGEPFMVLSVYPLRMLLDASDRLLYLVVLFGAVFASLALFMGDRIARAAVSPIKKLMSDLGAVDVRNISGEKVEVPEASTEDIRYAADQINALLSRMSVHYDTLKRFTSDVSHDLRTPLSVIRGIADVALARPRKPEYLEGKMGDVRRQAEMMMETIESMLKLARLDESGESADVEPSDLSADLLNALASARAFAKDRGVNIRTEMPLPSSWPSVLLRPGIGAADLILNILDNAVKYSPEGGTVDVSAEIRDELFIIIVGDRGAGMTSQEMERCFDRFWRGDGSRHSAGSGLGLSIAARLAEIHGADIRLSAREGGGTEAFISFRIAAGKRTRTMRRGLGAKRRYYL